MYNAYDSPIQYNNGMGNILPIDEYNMGGYYNEQYNNMYNPYYYAQQQQLEQERYMKEREEELEVEKMMVKGCYKVLNIDVDESVIDDAYSPEPPEPPDYEEEKTYELMDMMDDRNTVYYNMDRAQALNEKIELHERNKQRVPDNMGMKEFNEISAQLVYEIVDREDRIRERNLQPLYNSDDYNKLLNMRESTYFDKFRNNKEISIDDIEVGLSSKALVKFREIKKMKDNFIKSITSNC